MKKYKNYNDYELLYLLDWHSDEALSILLEKYDNLIKAKLVKFRINKNNYYDYFQELRMSVLQAIKTYDDRYGKSFCRFLELVLERRLIRLLYNDSRSVSKVEFLEETIAAKGSGEVLDEMIYEARIKEIKEMKLDNIKTEILNQVLIKGISAKEYAKMHNLPIKEVYNHIYLLRSKFKDRFNL